MQDWINTVFSLFALMVALGTTWYTYFRRGKLFMTQPTSIFFGPDGRYFELGNKVFLRTLLYSSSLKGQVLENMYASVERGETKQNFSIWVCGQKDNLARGSGLFVPHEGITLDHHFLLPADASDFRFLAGGYRLTVFARTVNAAQPIRLFTVHLEVSESQAQELQSKRAGLYFDWGPDQQKYYPHIDYKTHPPPRPLWG